MFLSKIWFILIALVSRDRRHASRSSRPRPFERRLGALEGQRLDRAQYAAEQMFKVDAHKWIDHVGKLGRDAIIAESLDAASRGSGEIDGHPPHDPGPLPHADPRPGERRHRFDRRHRHQGARHRARRREREGVRRLHRRRRDHRGRAARLPVRRRLGRGRPAAAPGGGAGAVEEPRPDRRRRVRQRRDRPGAGRAPEEEPRRRHRAVAARQGDRVVAPAGPSWTRCPS